MYEASIVPTRQKPNASTLKNGSTTTNLAPISKTPSIIGSHIYRTIQLCSSTPNPPERIPYQAI